MSSENKKMYFCQIYLLNHQKNIHNIFGQIFVAGLRFSLNFGLVKWGFIEPHRVKFSKGVDPRRLCGSLLNNEFYLALIFQMKHECKTFDEPFFNQLHSYFFCLFSYVCFQNTCPCPRTLYWTIIIASKLIFP